MDRFNYSEFNTYYSKLCDELQQISELIEGTNRIINDNLAYAENSTWGSDKISTWNATYGELVVKRQKIEEMLKTAKAVCDNNQSFEASVVSQ